VATELADQVAIPRAPAGFAVAARTVRVLAWTQLAAAGLLFVGAMLVYGAEIVMRGFLNTSYPEYYEVVGISFVWIFFLSAAALYARDHDVVIDMVFKHVPARVKPWWVFVVQVAIAATMVLTLVYTLQLIGLQSRTPTPLLRVPEAIRWWPLAVASASMVLSSLVEAWACVVWAMTGEKPKVWPNGFFDHEEDEEETAVL
jgi:TRAP-type C4-dicarboxylate transport system permease small subunit